MYILFPYLWHGTLNASQTAGKTPTSRGDLDREQISVFDLNSDEINRSVHYVHHILEQQKKSRK